MSNFVLVAYTDSQFGFMDTVAAELAAGFGDLGCQAIATHLFDKGKMEIVSSIILNTGIRMAVFMNGVGLEAPDSNLMRYLANSGTPIIGYFLDHPAYHQKRIASALPGIGIAASCRHDEAFIHRFIRRDVDVALIHHGATPVPTSVAKPWNERDIGVLVPSTLPLNPEITRPEWAARYGDMVAAQLNAIVEVHDAEPTRSLLDAIIEVLGDQQITLNQILPYYCVVDIYLRARIKLLSVRALLDQGVPVTVMSSGWPELGKGATYLPGVPILEGFELMGRSKIVLNHLPPYFDSHERPLQAAMCGAIGASTPSNWVEKVMGGQALMLPYDVDEAAAMVAGALVDPGLSERIAPARAAVESGHLWRHRAMELAAAGGIIG